MANIHKLIKSLCAQEQELCKTQFLAPCVLGASVITRLSGLIYKFAPQPNNFVGWAIFQPVNERLAKVVEEADLPMIAEYLQLFKSFRLRLAYKLESLTWLAYPINEADMRQRLGFVKPIVLHLVTEGLEFEQVMARFDGGAWWFEDIDRTSDPMLGEQLREATERKVLAKDLRFSGLTPEMRTTYSFIEQRRNREQERLKREKELLQREKLKLVQNSDQYRLSEALRVGGNAKLKQFQDRGDYWVVDWSTKDGERNTSAISKRDLTVISSGICLSGMDRNFDLQSLVKIIERRFDY